MLQTWFQMIHNFLTLKRETQINVRFENKQFINKRELFEMESKFCWQIQNPKW